MVKKLQQVSSVTSDVLSYLKDSTKQPQKRNHPGLEVVELYSDALGDRVGLVFLPIYLVNEEIENDYRWGIDFLKQVALGKKAPSPTKPASNAGSLKMSVFASKHKSVMLEVEPDRSMHLEKVEEEPLMIEKKLCPNGCVEKEEESEEEEKKEEEDAVIPGYVWPLAPYLQLPQEKHCKMN